MRFVKKQSDTVAAVLDPQEMKASKDIIGGDTVHGWSIFDRNGVDVASDGVSETVIAVCSNAIDLASQIGAELNESDEHPTLTFMKGQREMHSESFARANLVVLRDKNSGTSGGNRHVR